MAESLRLAVLKWVCDYLGTEVSVVNGYSYDLAGNVFRGRLTFGQDDPLPRLSFLEGLNPDREPVVAGDGNSTQFDRWIVLLQGQVADDPVNPTDPAHALLADVKSALGKLQKRLIQDREHFDGTPIKQLDSFGIEPGTVRPPDEISNKAFFWMRIVLKLVEDVDDPYWRP